MDIWEETGVPAAVLSSTGSLCSAAAVASRLGVFHQLQLQRTALHWCGNEGRAKSPSGSFIHFRGTKGDRERGGRGVGVGVVMGLIYSSSGAKSQCVSVLLGVLSPK